MQTKYDAQALIASKIIQKWHLNNLELSLFLNLFIPRKQKLNTMLLTLL
jgi:hypothetical protein